MASHSHRNYLAMTRATRWLPGRSGGLLKGRWPGGLMGPWVLATNRPRLLGLVKHPAEESQI